MILGIDPGLRRCGYAVLAPSGPRVLDAGIITTTPRGELARRLREIEEGLEELLERHRARCVAVEDLYAHYKHPRTAILMGHARGVVLLVAARRGLPVVSIGATQIKKSLTGNGHAAKRQVQQAILVTLGLRRMPDPPDVADAIAAALAAVELTRTPGRDARGRGRRLPDF